MQECGEERWAEVPKRFSKRLQSIIRSLPTGTTAREDLQPPPGTHTRSDSLPSSAPNNGISNQAPHQGHGIQQAVSPSSDPSSHRRPPGLQASIFDKSLTQHRVLLVVKRGHNYRLAQIRVSGSNHDTFFGTLREEYFRLRGMMRSWFSVWRYNHCEFYEFEKFDDHLFAPRTKNAFPSHGNTEYEYLPRPIDNIPPISEHAFWCKFYACHKPRPYHLHHKCNQRRSHSNEMLKSLPKKKTELEEGGDKREYFWGIYACENISIRWIIFYNFLCVSPLLAFFVAWIIPQEHGTDLQNPSIPLSMMCSMLSLFWSVYLSSLQFGRSH
ncbi:hypothetical protein P168DRAFT_136900 [Aspergillus campestris IBT 28561]|uniref:Uncharacterized protein n=1 Tax=Aspergillus campestris (strain IBT 28561) TaxID=1392248 RepID=A0A2I1D447_ASPC2|nr:uncharacterized protein P168DRAFT_136900 [Aspergillus campestris IBT 28561]PKY04628.1 hypothetical protein P168DRAFT_136900 [Aspergillus campestris IBT 28561]